jgi:hypothetical protein
MLLEDAQRGGFDIVLIEALDRVSRDHADVATLFKHLRFAVVQIGWRRNLRVSCWPQKHDECAVSEGPRRQDQSWSQGTGGEGQSGRRATRW